MGDTLRVVSKTAIGARSAACRTSPELIWTVRNRASRAQTGLEEARRSLMQAYEPQVCHIGTFNV